MCEACSLLWRPRSELPASRGVPVLYDSLLSYLTADILWNPGQMWHEQMVTLPFAGGRCSPKARVPVSHIEGGCEKECFRAPKGRDFTYAMKMSLADLAFVLLFS